MYKIAVLGDRDSVLGFKALGLDTYFVETTDEARHTLHQLAKEDYAIIYVTEQLAANLSADILIPGKTGSLGIGAQALQSAVERAVGADIG